MRLRNTIWKTIFGRMSVGGGTNPKLAFIFRYCGAITTVQIIFLGGSQTINQVMITALSCWGYQQSYHPWWSLTKILGRRLVSYSRLKWRPQAGLLYSSTVDQLLLSWGLKSEDLVWICHPHLSRSHSPHFHLGSFFSVRAPRRGLACKSVSQMENFKWRSLKPGSVELGRSQFPPCTISCKMSQPINKELNKLYHCVTI